MKVIIKRKPGAGRKRKISHDQTIEILKSKLSVAQLAEKYDVGRHTIYLIYKREKIKNMNIEIENIDDDLPESMQETCIFCDKSSPSWTVDKSINRPVCMLCSRVYKPNDIPNAPYNY